MNTLILVTLAYLVSAVVVVIAMKKAREGVEDHSGFRFQRRPQLSSVSRKPSRRRPTEKAA